MYICVLCVRSPCECGLHFSSCFNPFALHAGTGESGKSTVFKQMKILYKDGFDKTEITTFRGVIRDNIITCIQTLIDALDEFDLELDVESQEPIEMVGLLLLNACKFFHCRACTISFATHTGREGGKSTRHRMER